MTWHDWYKVRPMECLKPGSVQINKAEFLAALITCDTFADHCSDKLTELALDNYVAKSWFDSARCPIFPFDRYAQGLHLYMLHQSMKVQTYWIASAENKLADACSRQRFERGGSPHVVANTRLRQVRPRWASVLKFT